MNKMNQHMIKSVLHLHAHPMRWGAVIELQDFTQETTPRETKKSKSPTADFFTWYFLAISISPKSTLYNVMSG